MSETKKSVILSHKPFIVQYQNIAKVAHHNFLEPKVIILNGDIVKQRKKTKTNPIYLNVMVCLVVQPRLSFDNSYYSSTSGVKKC